MRAWFKAMFGRTCQLCGGRKPWFTHYCDNCWEYEGGRAYD